MAKSLIDYPISYPYGATSPPYSSSSPHRGNDRAAPCGTPVLIGNDKIGEVGTSGQSTGCHTHTQAGRDMYAQQTINPAPYEFKRGTVVAVRTTDSGAWGLYVDVRTESGVYVVYAHLGKINVKVGQKVGYSSGGDMTEKQAHDLGVQAYRTGLHREPESSAAAKSMGKRFESASGVITPEKAGKALASIRGIEWKGQDAKLKEYSELKEHLKILDEDLRDERAKVELLKKQAGEDTILLNKLGQVLMPLLARWGIKK